MEEAYEISIAENLLDHGTYSRRLQISRCLWVLFPLVLGALGERRPECGGVLRETSGEIESPGYPREYPVGIECIWIFEVDQPIALTFEDFALDGSRDCLKEHVEILEGENRWTFCGENNPGTIFSQSDQVTIIFRSDGNRAVIGNRAATGERGFRMAYNSTCDEGWTFFQGHCYYFNDTGLSDFGLDEAEEACQEMGAHVASVHSPEEDAFIASHGTRSFNYIGAITGSSFPSDRFDFEFLDGTPTDYQNFYEPGFEMLFGPGWVVNTIDQWMNFPCNEIRPYVCGEGAFSFYIYDSPMNFEDAKDACRSDHEDLVKVSDQTKRESLLVSFLNDIEPHNPEFWIGLQYDQASGDWTWVQDGSLVTLDNWAPGYPTSDGGDCAAMVPSTWATVGVWSNGWTCKKPAASP
ncbi:unnamed protein product [Darwinula stevensoni]|uniref:Uncharacterized protein n=1 Tax=Darwinula stevensoni TaxID=69355 RepID=A0A7R9AC49_9CRUS|nr:unnamed protein product [Darwinula stevensoni]CAG0899670.1 unnamed protein product [Darwinula stevensoni]